MQLMNLLYREIFSKFYHQQAAILNHSDQIIESRFGENIF